MTKTNERVIKEFVSNTWYGQDYIAHNDNLSVYGNVLMSFGKPLAIYFRHNWCPFRVIYKHNNRFTKKHFKILMDELDRLNAKNKYLLVPKFEHNKGEMKIEF